jgi:hypothetical protein
MDALKSGRMVNGEPPAVCNTLAGIGINGNSV